MTNKLYRITFETSLLIYSDEDEVVLVQQAKRYLPYEVENSKVVNIMPVKYLSSLLSGEKSSFPYQNPGLPEITVDEILANPPE